MSIVKMKRLRAVALRKDKDRLLRELRERGCVELRQPAGLGEGWDLASPAEADALARVNGHADLLREALDDLKRLSPEKKGLLTPLPQVSETEFFDNGAYRAALRTAAEISDAQRDLNGFRAQRDKLLQQRALLAPWLEIPVPLESAGTRETAFLFAYAPRRTPRSAVLAALDAATDLYDVTWGGEDRDNRYFLIICHASVREDLQSVLLNLGGGRVNLRDRTGTAAENDAVLQAKVSELEDWMSAARKRLEDALPRRPALAMALDRADQEVALERAKGKLLDTNSTVFLEGWLPADQERPLKLLLDRFGAAYEMSDPTEEEYSQVPIQLKNNPVTGAVNPITEMYSMPAYDSVDPNPLMAPFFIAFFGFMMNDIGYGLLMVLGTAVYLRMKRPKGNSRNMMLLFLLCGVSSIFWGCLTGSFFGDFFPQLFKLLDPASDFVWFWPPLFTPISDTILVMIGSMALGAIQVFTGMAISVAEKFRHGAPLDALFDEISWWVIIGCGVWAILGGGTVALVALGVAVAALVVGGTRKEKGFGKVTGAVGIIYNGVTGFFSDILSYLRLMALMMAGSIIAQVFNTLGAVFGLVGFVIVSLIGNALNLVLNLLGCYVHTLRLQCLEFFGRFYKDGGKPFKPLTVDTQYVDIIKGGN